MAKVGFRREIMGFNRSEVIDYIKGVQKDYNEREKSLLESLEKLNKRNSELIDELKKIPQLEMQLQMSEATADKLAKEIANYSEMKETSKRTSENIAKMYLVAKSNAASVEKATADSAERAMFEISNTMNMLKSVHTDLNTVKGNLLSVSQQYCDEINAIISSFDEAGKEINEISDKLSLSEDKKINV